ncbi:hypothetical protein ACFPPA_11645 [Rhodanobacter ginsengisoli]|uniref:Nucleotidyltransferase n=1 Tax=Rhodanobacter ginsengisoli TaxID=418646 RepID=A0ABW0QN35_9GAMM
MTACTDVDAERVLREVLRVAVPDLWHCCRDPWVVIGSGAARLIGADVSVADLDALTSRRDAESLIEHWQARRDPALPQEGVERFRSRFARFVFPGLAVEVMGGLEVRGADGWMPVTIGEVVELDIAGVAVAVPTVAEQIRLLESFGRLKDRQRLLSLKLLTGELQ